MFVELEHKLRLFVLRKQERFPLFSGFFLLFDKRFVGFIQLLLVILHILDKTFDFFVQHRLFKLRSRLKFVQTLNVLLVKGLKRLKCVLQLRMLISSKA